MSCQGGQCILQILFHFSQTECSQFKVETRRGAHDSPLGVNNIIFISGIQQGLDIYIT